MTWLRNLLTNEQSIATAILVLALTVVIGLAIGRIRIRGIHLGVAGVLFSGLLLGHFGIVVQADAADFAREFGLVLFIYAVGTAVGPGFFNAVRAYGAKTNLLAIAVVALGTMLAGIAVRLGGIAPPIAVGVLAGATTNTPSLAAAGQTLDQSPPETVDAISALHQIGIDGTGLSPASIRDEVEKLPGLGYAVAYPGGVVGIILSFLILRRLFDVDPVSDARRLESEVSPPKVPLERWVVRITRLEKPGTTADQLPMLAGSSAVVSRIRRNGQTFVALGTTPLAIRDILQVVGVPQELQRFCQYVGESVDVAELSDTQEIVARWILISKKRFVGRTLENSQITERFHVRITRIRRGETELLSFADLRLAFGDSLFAVGSPEAIAGLAHEAGDTAREVEEPHLLPMFFGIGLGVVLGSVPLAVPGLAAPLKIGLAGGPLLVALALSHLHRVGPLVFYMPRAANTALKDLGISLFLAAVGLKSGSRFIESLTQGNGVWWLAWGLAVTLLPLLVVGIVSIAMFRAPYTAVVGVLAGSMTDPPALAFAHSITKSDSPALAYATVYPTAMILRVVAAQVFLVLTG